MQNHPLWVPLCALLSLGLACSATALDKTSELDLSGPWTCQLDPANEGVDQQWFKRIFSQSLTLPGTLAGHKIGEPITRETPWIGAISNPRLWFDTKYDALAGESGYKVPFWLSPGTFYTGAAWYQKRIHIPEGWKRSRVILELERVHWESKAWLNDVYLGTHNALATPHRFELPADLAPGEHVLTLRIDNSYIVPVGINAHSVSDNTQGNWNGVVGHMKLVRKDPVSIDNIQVFPDLAQRTVWVTLELGNTSGRPQEAEVRLMASSDNTSRQHASEILHTTLRVGPRGALHTIELPMGGDFLAWSEWDPAVYQLTVGLAAANSRSEETTSFGMREIVTAGTQFELNGRKIFLRGTLECSIFPNEGHPPADEAAWERIFRIVKGHGLNHVRFHSWCPPKAAFAVADRLGIYLMPEAGAWATQGLTLGDGHPMDEFVYQETDRMLREFGNHPSFLLMAYGNEADGTNASRFLDQYVAHYKARDRRRLHTSSAGWPTAPANQFLSTLQGRIQQWTDKGSTYYLEDHPPSSAFHYNDLITGYGKPFVSHEIGQWCAYPDFTEIAQYTGVYRPEYLELYRAELEQKGMLHQAEDFLFASGRLQVLCYKAEIEAALRTRGMGGFQLLDLHDFPGQGVALVGILNALWESKGYITEQEFRQFCGPTVLLAGMDSHVLTDADRFHSSVLVSHFGAAPLPAGTVIWEVLEAGDAVRLHGVIPFDSLENGSGQTLGEIHFDAGRLDAPGHYRLRLRLEGAPIENHWDFFLFPAGPGDTPQPAGIYRTERLDASAKQALASGGTVWLDVHATLKEEYHGRAGFTPVYWNTLTFHSQPIHTLGILCDPAHPLYEGFPTQRHSNWQWWDVLTKCRAMVLDGLPDVPPLLQMIDSYHSNRKLGLIAEARCGGGRILISSIDFHTGLEQRPASRQLKRCILHYLQSSGFDPKTEIPMAALERMLQSAADTQEEQP